MLITRPVWRTSPARRKLLPSTMRLPSPGLMRVFAMELFTKLFGDLLLFVYHCFDRIVINGYLSGLSRPEQVVHFFRKVVGVAVLSKEILSQRTAEYQNWVEAFARNHNIPVEWAEKGVRKEDYVLPWLRRMTKRNAYGVYFIFKSMEQGPTFRVRVPKYPTKDPNHRILARQRSRFTHDYFYIRDEVLGPMAMRVATFFPFQTTYYLNGHSFIEQELNRAQVGFRKNDNAFVAVDDVAALQAAADKLSPDIIRKRLDYWTFILGPKLQAGQAVAHLRYHPGRILLEHHIQTQLSNSQAVRAKLRTRPLAADASQDCRGLRHPPPPQAPRQTLHHHRSDRARPSCVPRLFPQRGSPTVREVLDAFAQRALLEQPLRLRSAKGAGASRRGAPQVPGHHQPLRRIPGSMAPPPCHLSPH